jgi:hypothetical protein
MPFFHYISYIISSDFSKYSICQTFSLVIYSIVSIQEEIPQNQHEDTFITV